MSYTVHTIETAAESAKPALVATKEAYGFVPNLLAVMAEAPMLLKAYRALSELFEETSLSPSERQVVLLTASYENGCEYCVAAHTVVAAMDKVPVDVVSAIRDGKPIADRKLEPIRRFTATVVASRGWPSDAETEAFLNAGYGKQQVLEVVLGVGIKTLSNYTNHIAHTPLDRAFATAAWRRAA